MKVITTLCLYCSVVLITIMMGCSNGSNPIGPPATNDQQNQQMFPPENFAGFSDEGPGSPPIIPEEGITVKLEAHPSFIGVAYVSYPMQFRAIVWNKDGEIIGFIGSDFDPIDQQNFVWEEADENGILIPINTGEVVVSVTYKGIRSNSIVVNAIEPKISEIQIVPYWPVTMYLGDILAPFTLRIIDASGGLISTDPTRVTWIGGPDANGIFQPTEVGIYTIYAKAENGVESGHMILEVVEP